MKNRFKGDCYGCCEFVAAGAGVYEGGYVFCSEPVTNQDVPDSLRLRFDATVKRWAVCLKRANEILGTQFESIEPLREQQRAEHIANLPTPEEIEANKARAKLVMAEDRKQRRQELAEFKARNVCPRCHGAGGSDAWLATGWFCNRCHGSGKF